jgi:hypothetical protein
MKRAAIVLLLLLMFSGEAAARELDFSGLRPHTGKVNPRPFSFYIGILPYAGFRNIKSLGKIPDFVHVVSGFSIPDGTIRSIPRLFNDVNDLYRSKFTIQGVVLPQVRVGLNYKHFEFSFRGGAVNFITSKVFLLEKEIDFFQIYFPSNGTPYLRTDEQRVLHIKAHTLLGGEFWGTVRVPVKTPKYRLHLLLGLGGDVGYLHSYEYSVRIAKRFSQYDIFTNELLTSKRVIGHLGLRFGFQLDGYKYLRPRVVLEAMGLVSHDPTALPRLNLGVSIRIWKLGTLNASVMDLANPEGRVEFARRFGKNNEVAFGGVLRSKQFKSDLGYLTLSVGSKLVKFTSTMLFEKTRIGLLVGVGLGYWP